MEHQDWNTISIGKKRVKSESKGYVRSHYQKKMSILDEETGDNMKKKTYVFGKEIIKLRSKKKLKQKELAQMLNVKVSVLIDWENCKSDPPNNIKNKIKRILS